MNKDKIQKIGIIWRHSVGIYTLYDTRSRKWTKFFLVKDWGPKPPGNPSELIFALFGGLWGQFFKKPKYHVFQNLNFPDPVSQLLEDLEN